MVNDKAWRTQSERGKRRETLQQSLEILNVSGALQRIYTEEVLVGLKRSAIYKHLKEGRFPAPVRNAARRIRPFSSCREVKG
ncbi:MAG: AlpA family phage regulatory protein [Pseudomonadota bacterium]